MNEYLPYLSELLNGALSGLPYFRPELALAFTFLLVILADLFFPQQKSRLAFWICLGGILVSAAFTVTDMPANAKSLILFTGSIGLDKAASSFKLVFALSVVLFMVFIKNNRQLQEHKKGIGDLYMLVPAVLLGLNLMAMSNSLLMIYISIEMVSIASYLMVGYVSGESRQAEAAMKYALFGSVCSAVMLYGISLLYAFTGSIVITDPAFLSHLSIVSSPAVALAIILTLAGIGFKLSFVPLHFWSPDVYEGAPVPVTAFLSTAPKIAGFALLIKFLGPFYSSATTHQQLFDFETCLSVVAIATMITGNFAALWQNNVKRMLAYSSIGHTGFAMMAVIAFSGTGINALLFYFTAYTLMNMVAFMLAGRIEELTGATTSSGYKGLGKFMKTEMACFVIVLVSLTGLPPTAGFIGKFLVFSAAFEKYSATGSIWILALLITGAITTVVSLFYYFKIPLNVYLRNNEHSTVLSYKVNLLTYVIVALAMLLIIAGIFPDIFIGIILR